MCETDQQGEPTAPRRDSVLCGDLNGEEIQKGVYVNIELMQFALQQTLTRYCKAALLQ